jgi:hypothetical protein
MQWMALPAAILAFTQLAGAQDVDPFGGRDLPPTTPRSILEQRDCHSTDLQEAATSWTKIASLPQFDPALGILRGYRLTLTAKVAGDAGVENLSGEPANVTLTFGSRLTVSRPGGGVLIDLAPSKAFPDQLSAFDGLLNYAGTSGVTHTHLDLDSIEGSAVSSSSDLRTFSGSPGHPGSLDFIVSVENTSGATGAGDLSTLFHQTASADLTICYIYDATATRTACRTPRTWRAAPRWTRTTTSSPTSASRPWSSSASATARRTAGRTATAATRRPATRAVA